MSSHHSVFYRCTQVFLLVLLYLQIIPQQLSFGKLSFPFLCSLSQLPCPASGGRIAQMALVGLNEPQTLDFLWSYQERETLFLWDRKLVA